MAYKEAET